MMGRWMNFEIWLLHTTSWMLPSLWPRQTSNCFSDEIREFIWHSPFGLSLVSKVKSFLELLGKEKTWICLLKTAINLDMSKYVNWKRMWKGGKSRVKLCNVMLKVVQCQTKPADCTCLFWGEQQQLVEWKYSQGQTFSIHHHKSILCYLRTLDVDLHQPQQSSLSCAAFRNEWWYPFQMCLWEWARYYRHCSAQRCCWLKTCNPPITIMCFLCQGLDVVYTNASISAASKTTWNLNIKEPMITKGCSIIRRNWRLNMALLRSWLNFKLNTFAPPLDVMTSAQRGSWYCLICAAKNIALENMSSISTSMYLLCVESSPHDNSELVPPGGR